jgi:DNA-binding NtrC family response regulator
VLVVEDEPIILHCTADDLRDEGFTVYEAHNADAALLALEEHTDIGVMFTDVDMPGNKNGLTMSFVVREQHPDMKIFITSGMHHVPEYMMPTGGIFLPKPYLPSSGTGHKAAAYNFGIHRIRRVNPNVIASEFGNR